MADSSSPALWFLIHVLLTGAGGLQATADTLMGKRVVNGMSPQSTRERKRATDSTRERMRTEQRKRRQRQDRLRGNREREERSKTEQNSLAKENVRGEQERKERKEHDRVSVHVCLVR